MKARTGFLLVGGFYSFQSVVSALISLSAGFIYGASDSKNRVVELQDFFANYGELVGLCSTLIASGALFAYIFSQVRNLKVAYTWQTLGIRKLKSSELVAPCLCGVLIATFYILLLVAVSNWKGEAHGISLLEKPFTGMLIFAIVTVLVVAPVIEEFLFRGILLKSCINILSSSKILSIGLAVSLNTVLFCGLHYANIYEYPVSLFGLVGLSLIACYFRLKDRSIFSAIALHASYNLTLLLFTN